MTHGWVLGRLKPRMSVATSVITSLKLLAMASTSPSSSSRGPNLPPILASNRLEMFGYLDLVSLLETNVCLFLMQIPSSKKKI